MPAGIGYGNNRDNFLDNLLKLQNTVPQDMLMQMLLGGTGVNPVPAQNDNQGQLEEVIIRRKKGGDNKGGHDNPHGMMGGNPNGQRRY
jgi:hypothetical protein